jgi:hypothetical protein
MVEGANVTAIHAQRARSKGGLPSALCGDAQWSRGRARICAGPRSRLDHDGLAGDAEARTDEWTNRWARTWTPTAWSELRRDGGKRGEPNLPSSIRRDVPQAHAGRGESTITSTARLSPRSTSHKSAGATHRLPDIPARCETATESNSSVSSHRQPADRVLRRSAQL